MNPTGVLALIVALLLMVACAGDREVLIATATPNIEATVQAAVAAAIPTPTPTPLPDLDATVSAGIAATLAAIPTPTPTAIPVPTATPTPTPTATPTPTPEPTSTPIPTPTPTPWPTPRPTLTPTPRPTPRPTFTPTPRPTATQPPSTTWRAGESPTDVADSLQVVQADNTPVQQADSRAANQAVALEGVTGSYVVGGGSEITFTVGQVLARSPARIEAVMRGTDISGQINTDGRTSTIQMNLHILSSDQELRDRYVRSRMFPNDPIATFTVGSVGSLPPEFYSGDTFHRSVSGTLNLKGKDIPLTFDLEVRNDGNVLNVLGRTIVTWDQLEIPVPTARSVVSIEDDIHVQILLIATQQVDCYAAIGRKHDRTSTSSESGPTQMRGREPGGLTAMPMASHEFGSTGGQLRHNPSNRFVQTEYADVSIVNMVVEATFVNPYSTRSNSWDYGFILRRSRDLPFIQVVVDGYGGWALMTGDDAPYNRIAGGTIGGLNTSTGGCNHVQVVTIWERGWLFVNGEFVSTLDLSPVTRAGDVAVMTGAYTGNQVAGAVTNYENFRGRQLTKQYGPAEGRLQGDPGYIAEQDSGVRTRDLVAEAKFINPQGFDWGYGFTIRNPVFNRLEVIGLTGDRRWFHKTRSVGDDAYTIVANGRLSDTGASFLSRNRLLLLAFGESGWLFLNDQLVAKLELSHNMEHGQISAMGDFFLDHDGSPRFEDFSVWAP